ncbi:AIDA repeat-containing protein [Pantoea ananatis]|uniref:AIDA repeat-containing protein n=2 Tax=Pantoea ananas TaxID=553 RepID=UPI0023B032E1|nr:AIDA repeat-containing protein [Pantoea ananatis]
MNSYRNTENQQRNRKMNKAYRIVWSAARQAWVVASEKAGGSGRPPLAVKKAAAALLLLGVTGSALATDYSGSTVSGGFQYVSAGDKADNVMVIEGGTQNVDFGGSTTDTVVVGYAEQGVFGGTAIFTQLHSGGRQSLNLGSAIGTIVNKGSKQEVWGGLAVYTVVNDGATQEIKSPRHPDFSGTARSTTVNSGGTQKVNSGGTALGTTVSGGDQYLYDGSSASDTTVNTGGNQYVSGGSAISTTLNYGGTQTIYSGGSASDTTVNTGGNQYVSGGSASGAVLSGGSQFVSSGGLTTSATVNSGSDQYIYSGASASGTTVNTGGNQYIYIGGSATVTTLNAGGKQHVSSGGSASGTTVSSGGALWVDSGASAGSVAQLSGGALQTTTRATLSGTNALGTFSVSGGQASHLLLENGGGMLVLAGDTATSTTVNAGGMLAVDRGGILDGTTTLTDGAMLTAPAGQQGASVINRGTLKFSQQNNSAWSGSLTGSGQLTKDGSGTLTLGGTLNQSQVNLNDGSLVMDGLQAVTNIIAKAATTLSLVNGATLTGSIDPTDVNIDGGSTWNITGDSQVNNLTNAGSIVFAPSSGTFTPHTLTVSNFTGSGGTLTLNTVAGDSSSPSDRVVIDGGRATGSTNLNVLNHGGLGAQTAGSGIPVIQAINGATTDAGAFSMSNPLVAGAYEYSLYRNADESWYLTTQKTSGGGTSGGGTSGGGTSGGDTSGGDTSGGDTSGGDTSGSTTSGGSASGGSAVPSGEVNYRAAMWSYAAMPSLSMDYDRLVAGEADTRFRYAPDSRIWGRLTAGKLSHRNSGSLTGGSVPESSSAYSFFQLGGDLWQLDGANADWRAGIYGATGVMRSDVSRDSGTASAGTDRDTVYTGGAYLSGRSHSGLHIDGLLQASRHSLKAASEDGTRLSTHGTGWLASAEVGQAFTLTPSLALEPQLQYQVQGLSLNDGQDGAASLRWSDSRRQSVRAGLKLGTPQDAKTKLAWWVTPSVTQSYGGHSGFTASVPGVAGSEASFRNNRSGTSVGLNGGVSAHIRKNVTLGVQAGWSESLHGSEAGGYSGMLNLGVSFR